MNKGALVLYNKLKAKNFTPTRICEVGVFMPEESNILQFIADGIPTTLVEADPNFALKIKNYFKDRKNVTLVEAAVFDENGTVELCRRDSSTFISSLDKSPVIINNGYQVAEEDKFTAKAIKFSEVDDGDFDLLSVDIEGAEWYVIKHMVSRPAVICLETHGKYYINSKITEINRWMADNKYRIWYKDKADTIYVKQGTFDITLLDNLSLLFTNLKLSLVRLKGKIKGVKS